jgi:hypothetical protein
MKFAILPVLILVTCGYAHSQTPSVKSQGACSPNIIENKGEIRFTCQATLDAATLAKLNQVLNEVLSKGNQSSDVSAKLDEILAFIRPRLLDESQTQSFLNALRTGQKGAIRLLVVASDAETFAFSRQIGGLLIAAGWTVDYETGIIVNGDPSGIVLSVTNQQDPSAFLLQNSLKLVGVAAPGLVEPKQDVPIILRIGGKPLPQ